MSDPLREATVADLACAPPKREATRGRWGRWWRGLGRSVQEGA